MKIHDFVSALNTDFFSGVPDSLLSPLCNYLMKRYETGAQHIVAANEGNAVALAAGYHLATGGVPVVYMQNSGIGNIINPAASLLHPRVYGIPCLFVVGWRGEPGVHDEPQHVFQGEVTVGLLEAMDISTFVVDTDTDPGKLAQVVAEWKVRFDQGRSSALVVRKGALQADGPADYRNSNTIMREEAIRRIAAVSGTDIVVGTTGKASRELFEIRKQMGQSHQYDFLTVGSMGHSSSIAMGIALQKPDRRIWCVDGDGAMLMHMGAMGVIGASRPANLVHVVLNNGAHETVGGVPTVAGALDLPGIARCCGYPVAESVRTETELDEALGRIKPAKSLCFLEVLCAMGARADLGRPTTTAQQNKEGFMKYLQENKGLLT